MSDNLNNATVPTAENAPVSSAKGGKTGRKHRTKEERMADLRAQLERLQNTPDRAAIESNPTYSRLAGIKKELAKRLLTLNHDRNGYVNGKTGAMTVFPLATRIERCEAQLAAYRVRLAQLDRLSEVLPQRMAEITSLMERAAAGEDVDIPDGILLDPNTPTAEAAFVASESIDLEGSAN